MLANKSGGMVVIMMLKKMFGTSSVSLAALSLVALGCSQNDNQPSFAETPDVEPAPFEDPQKDGSPLPYRVTDPHTVFEPPDLCSWAAAADAIVLGRLSSWRLANSPAIAVVWDPDLEPKDRWRYEDRCSSINPAIVLELDVNIARRGDAPEQVEAWIGAEQRHSLMPQPHWTEDGGMEWSSGGLGRPLATGQILGLALHYVPEHDLYSLMGEPMFGVDVDERIIFQPGVGGQHGPTEAIGMTVDEFEAAITACQQSEDSQERRASIWYSHGPDNQKPHYYRAAYCFAEDSDSPPTYDAGVAPADAG
jgi:hypothetical protein